MKTSYWYRWKRKGLSPSEPPRNVCESIEIEENKYGNGFIDLRFLCKVVMNSKKRTIFHHEINYRITVDGNILINVKVSPDRSLSRITTLPRIGMSMVLYKSLCDIQYLGRGPGENYPDRNSSSDMGIWQTQASKMGYNYIVPSENGNRTGCEWITFTDKDGNGLCVIDNSRSSNSQNNNTNNNTNNIWKKETEGIHFSALLHTQVELHEATHTYQLEKRTDGESPICVNIDHKMMGLGGDVGYVQMYIHTFIFVCKKYSLFLISLFHPTLGKCFQIQ